MCFLLFMHMPVAPLPPCRIVPLLICCANLIPRWKIHWVRRDQLSLWPIHKISTPQRGRRARCRYWCIRIRRQDHEFRPLRWNCVRVPRPHPEARISSCQALREQTGCSQRSPKTSGLLGIVQSNYTPTSDARIVQTPLGLNRDCACDLMRFSALYNFQLR